MSLISSSSFATTRLGEGYTCEGSNIIKGIKQYSNPRIIRSISTQLANTKKKSIRARGVNAQSLRKSVTTLSRLLTKMQACNAGRYVQLSSGGSIDPLWSQVAGHYVGTYTANGPGFGLPNFFGPMEARLGVNGSLVTGSVDFGGTLEVLTSSKKLEHTFDASGITFPYTRVVNGSDGEVTTVTIQSNGSFTVDSRFESLGIQMHGTMTGVFIGNNLQGQFDIRDKNNALMGNGSFDLNK